MTYTVKDKSVHDGAPIECYEFVADHKTWRYTSYHEAITVAGNEYEPLPITRTALEVGSAIDSPATMNFVLPADNELARTFCYLVSPKSLSVTVYRVHEGDDYATDYVSEWQGAIAGASASGKWATIKTQSILQTKLNAYASAVYYQKTCNHVLFDERCKIVRASYTVTATVTKVQGQIITVDDMSFADTELVAGEMTNTRTGEVQGIISNDSNILRIGYRFFDILVGDTVELTQGCDHLRLGDCLNRFDNVDNYGGFDFIPETNPFENLSLDTVTDTVSTIKTSKQIELTIPGENGKVV